MATDRNGRKITIPASYKLPPKLILTDEEWNELHDALELALDALGEGPQDVDMNYLVNCMMHQRVGLQLTHSKARGVGVDC